MAEVYWLVCRTLVNQLVKSAKECVELAQNTAAAGGYAFQT